MLPTSKPLKPLNQSNGLPQHSPLAKSKDTVNRQGDAPVVTATPSKIPKVAIETAEFLKNIAIILRSGLTPLKSNPDFRFYQNCAKNIFFALKHHGHSAAFVVDLGNQNWLKLQSHESGYSIEMHGESLHVDDQTIFGNGTYSDFNLLGDDFCEGLDDSEDKENLDLENWDDFEMICLDKLKHESKKPIVQSADQVLTSSLANEYNTSDKCLNALATNLNKEKRVPIHNPPLTGAIDANKPYIEITDERIISELNSKVSAPNSNEKYWCRHMTTQYADIVMAYIENGGDMNHFNLADFDNPESMAAIMPKENIEDDFNKLTGNANTYDIIDNHNFGAHLSSCFSKMQNNKANNSLHMLNSIVHSMGFRLRIVDGKNPFEVHYYDPNISNVEVHRTFKTLEDVRKSVLREYIDGLGPTPENSNYEHYYDGMNPCSIVLECYSDGVQQEKSAAINFDPDNITPVHLAFFFDRHYKNNTLDTLTDEQLKKIVHQYPEELVTMLGTKFMQDKNLFMHVYFPARVSRVLIKELAKKIEVSELVSLIEAKDKNNLPAICTALKMNDHKTVAMLASHIMLLDADDMQSSAIIKKFAKTVFDALRPSTDQDGTHQNGILMNAIVTGQFAALKAFVPAFKKLAGILGIHQHSVIETIAAKDANGEPALNLGFQGDKFKTIKMIEARDDNNIPTICTALKTNDHRAVAMLTIQILLLDEKDKRSFPAIKKFALAVFDALRSSTDQDGRHQNGILLDAITNGHLAALKAFVPALKKLAEILRIPPHLVAETIATKDANGTPALNLALQEDHFEAVKVYGRYIGLVTDITERAKLIEAEDAHEMPGVFFARTFDHEKSVQAWLQLLSHVKEDTDLWQKVLSSLPKPEKTPLRAGMIIHSL